MDYRCSSCKQQVERDLLTVKKVNFMTMGSRAKTLRTRVESWLCPACVAKDPVYNKERWIDAPGIREDDVPPPSRRLE